MVRFIKSLGFALNGIRVAIKEERNIKIQLSIALCVVVLGLYFEITTTEWIAILFCIGFVLVTELVNTAIENLIDGISPEQIHWAGKVKDIAAGAVLVASVISVIIALLIFIPYIFTS